MHDIELSLLKALYYYGLLNIIDIQRAIQADFIVLEARIDDLIEKGLVKYFPNRTGRFVFLTIAGYRDYLAIR